MKITLINLPQKLKYQTVLKKTTVLSSYSLRCNGARALKCMAVVLVTVLCSGRVQGQSQLFTYGSSPGAFGGEPSGDALALNNFNTGGSPVWVTEIGVLWNPLSAGAHPTVALYSDPNGDGNPSDMQPLLIQPIYIPPHVVVLNNGSAQFYSIPPTEVSGSFFVGAYFSDQNNSSPQIGIDLSNRGQGQSWVFENSTSGRLSLQNPIGTASDWENLDTIVSGNHIIEAMYTTSVPEPLPAWLFLFGSGIVMCARRILRR
jgi:hypothetical protein